MYEDLAKNLKKNIEIMTPTFINNNLQIINTGMKRLSREDGDFDYLIEISSITGGSIKRDLYINLNLYNSDGEIIFHDFVVVNRETFQGYDTISMCCYLDGEALLLAVKGRLYCSLS